MPRVLLHPCVCCSAVAPPLPAPPSLPAPPAPRPSSRRPAPPARAASRAATRAALRAPPRPSPPRAGAGRGRAAPGGGAAGEATRLGGRQRERPAAGTLVLLRRPVNPSGRQAAGPGPSAAPAGCPLPCSRTALHCPALAHRGPHLPKDHAEGEHVGGQRELRVAHGLWRGGRGGRSGPGTSPHAPPPSSFPRAPPRAPWCPHLGRHVAHGAVQAAGGHLLAGGQHLADAEVRHLRPPHGHTRWREGRHTAQHGAARRSTAQHGKGGTRLSTAQHGSARGGRGTPAASCPPPPARRLRPPPGLPFSPLTLATKP
jgi:hypothetical protein